MGRERFFIYSLREVEFTRVFYVDGHVQKEKSDCVAEIRENFRVLSFGRGSGARMED